MHRAPAAKLAAPPPANLKINTPRDPNTLSNYHNFRTTHTAVDFHIDFEQRRLSGEVVLNLKSLTEGEAKSITLDTSYLDVQAVKVGGLPVNWDLGSRVEPFGSPLTVDLGHGILKDESIVVHMTVSTTDKCSALQWLTPAQTSNRKHPYMFSQCQAIHARSIFPCQDTPDVKSTFSFRLRSALPVVASGRAEPIEGVTESGETLYNFYQPVPMPSYLFAVASGDIVGAPIGKRSEVWTGPDQLAAAKWELEHDMDKFLEIGEKIVYPYPWGTYNVLVLPPSFPYGGMENPQYTFATPTIISGDRQNVDLVAHELAHSWSGNLVSPVSWEHFWLNEGWTVYLERRIGAALHGEPFRDFSAIIGWKALEEAVALFGAEHEFTRLIVDLKGKDPDDAFSTVPYEKGFTFLYHLEKLVGRAKWDKFIPHYFTKFKYKSLDSYDFKACLLAFFQSDATASKALTDLDWDAWFYSPGLPPKPNFDTSLVDECYALADKWAALSPDSGFTPSPSDIAGLSSNQVVVFLERLQQLPKPLSAAHAELLGSTYGLLTSNNAELTARYFVIGLMARSEAVVPPTVDLLGKVGRMKFVRPLYRQLKKVDAELAKDTFQRNSDFYHPICRRMVEKDLYGRK